MLVAQKFSSLLYLKARPVLVASTGGWHILYLKPLGTVIVDSCPPSGYQMGRFGILVNLAEFEALSHYSKHRGPGIRNVLIVLSIETWCKRGPYEEIRLWDALFSMKTLLRHQSLHNAPFTKISVNLRDVWVKAHSIANWIQVQELRDIKLRV